MKQDRYSYPCIITLDKEDGIYYVNFPDLDDCFTDGDTLEEALYNAQDVLGLVLYSKEENGIEINPPKNDFIETKENQALSYVSVWMPLVRDEIENKSVKKTILSYPNPLLPITYFPIGLANSNKGRCTANIYSVLRPK